MPRTLMTIASLLLLAGLVGCGNSEQPGSAAPGTENTSKPGEAEQKEAKGEGLILAEGKFKKGYVDNAGTWVIEPVFAMAWPFSEERAAALKTLFGELTVIDTTGAEIFTTDYKVNANTQVTGLWQYHDGLIAVAAPDSEYHYYNKAGDKVFTLPGDTTGPLYYQFNDGMLPVKHDGKWGYIDTTGAWVIEPQYSFARPFGEGLAAVRIDGKYGFINKVGEIVLEPVFREALYFSEGLCPVTHEAAGDVYIDTTGKIAFEAKYAYAQPFSGGFAIVTDGGKHAFIDKTGKLICDFVYGEVRPFSEGMAAVKQGWDYGYIDTNGEVVIPLTLGSSQPFQHGIARVIKDGYPTLIRKDGSVLDYEKK